MSDSIDLTMTPRDLTILLPAYNEEQSIGKTIREIKNLYPDSYDLGTYTLKATVQDLAGNTISCSLIFIRGTPPATETTDGKASPGFEWSILLAIGAWILISPLFAKKQKK